MPYQEITRKASIDDILASRTKSIAEFRESMNALMQCNLTMRNGGYGSHVLSKALRDVSLYRLTECNEVESIVAKFVKELDKDIWQHVANITGMMQIMDSTAKKQWREDIEKQAPECTRENLDATFRQLNSQRKLIFNRGLVKAFKDLSRNYKTNDAFKIGPKIIVTNAIGCWSHGTDSLVDVERVLYVLDGLKPPDSRSEDVGGIISAAVGYRDIKQTALKSKYMNLKLFKNGNVHVAFTRPDLIDKANKIIAAFYGETLADARAA